MLSLREIELRADDRAEAEAIVDEAQRRLLALDRRGASDAEPTTIGLFAFRTPYASGVAGGGGPEIPA